MHPTTYLMLTASLLLMFLGLGILRFKTEKTFDKKVRQLFKSAGHLNGKVYHEASIIDLPEPVQRYFKRVLKDGKPYINIVRIRHNGKFRAGINKDWMTIRGEEYFTAANPGMLWIGKTKWFTASDTYISGEGKLNVRLLSALKIVNGQGVKFSQGELLRWLGESVWFPTNLLPNDFLKWTGIDQNTARLDFTFNNCNIHYIVTFSENGEITQLETQRYMGEKNLETWIGKLSDYREYNGVWVPTTMKASWRLKDSDFSYAMFRLNRIEYGKRKRFK